MNNRTTFFDKKLVLQEFGYSQFTQHAGGGTGEIGGKLNPAGEPAYYAYVLQETLTFQTAFEAKGLLKVAPGAGHFMVGFFNPKHLKEWRTRDSVFVRINSRGEGSHFHLEYGTTQWRAGAGVIGEIVPGRQITPKLMANDHSYRWELTFDPKGAEGYGRIQFKLNDETASVDIDPAHRRDGIELTHFGILPITKTWDTPGEIWLDNLEVLGTRFEFNTDPLWEGYNNRTNYLSGDTRPRFDFGWSPSHHAGGQKAGELGGLIFRGDCREAARLAAYGDRIGELNLNAPLEFSGSISFIRGITDATASIGFYHSRKSLTPEPSQKHSIPRNFFGINIEGPSSEGFFLYAVLRGDADEAVVPSHGPNSLRIYPDGRKQSFFFKYNPRTTCDEGTVTWGLNGQTLTMEIPSYFADSVAEFNRFGICTTWIDGNSVTIYYDDLTYTHQQ